MRPGPYLLGPGGAVPVLVWADQSPSEIANQATPEPVAPALAATIQPLRDAVRRSLT